jgi:hypothetical protein
MLRARESSLKHEECFGEALVVYNQKKQLDQHG